MSIPKFVKSIFSDIDSFPKEGLTQKDVIYKILKHDDKELSEKNIKNTQPSASRALNNLIGDKYITCDHGIYRPVIQEDAQQEALSQFSENVYCMKPDIFAVVDSMYLIKVHSDHVFAATEYLRRYLGPERYFDIFYSNSYLWVLWESKENDEEEFRTVYQEISDAVAISYDRYLDSLKKLTKLRKVETPTGEET